jgi:hypothetical protein
MFNKGAKMNKRPPIVDLNALAHEIDAEEFSRSAANYRGSPLEYAPPAVRNQQLPVDIIREVKLFGELMTRELDELFTRLDGKFAQFKERGEQLRRLYTKHTDEMADGLNKLEREVDLVIDTIRTLHDQCENVTADAPAAPAVPTSAPPPSPPKTTSAKTSASNAATGEQ